MTKILFDEKFEIYLFNGTTEQLGTSKLGEFLSFLKYYKAQMPYKFAFVSEKASLIPELSLIQNILIDFNPNSLTESKEVQFHDFLKAQKNKSFEELYNKINLPHELPIQSNSQMNKVASLIKALLNEGQFLFLEEPENYLEEETLNLFSDALKSQLEEKGVNVFIYSKNIDFWKPHAHKSVSRNTDYSFKVEEINEHSQWEKERQLFYSKSSENHPDTLIFRNLIKYTNHSKKDVA